MGNPFEGLFDSGDVLERVGIDITAQARRGDLEPVRCRDAEISRVVDILLRQGKNNAALVGRAGVGKTAVVEGLAHRIAAGEVPPALKDARILQLDHVSMLAGTSFRGQYEERIRRLVKALETDRNLILFVDELHNLMGQGTAMGAAMDAANMLKPALVRGDMRVIGATTAPTARNTPNGTSRFFLMDNGMKISEPSAAPAKTVSSTPRHPTKLPTIAIIFTSPPPIASSLNTHVPAIPTSHSSTKPTAAPSSAWRKPWTPPPSASRRPMTRPPQVNSSGLM